MIDSKLKITKRQLQISSGYNFWKKWRVQKGQNPSGWRLEGWLRPGYEDFYHYLKILKCLCWMMRES